MTLQVVADLGALARLRTALADTLAAQGWEQDEAGRVVLAAQEALVNAIEHGSRPGATITLRFRAGDAQASVCVRDRGVPGVAPLLRAPSAPPDNQPHGRGRLIMQALAERCESLARGSGTEVRLEFRRPGHVVQAAA